MGTRWPSGEIDREREREREREAGENLHSSHPSTVGRLGYKSEDCRLSNYEEGNLQAMRRSNMSRSIVNTVISTINLVMSTHSIAGSLFTMRSQRSEFSSGPEGFELT